MPSLFRDRGSTAASSVVWTTTTLLIFSLSILLTIEGCDGQLRLGKAINLFIRYGYLSISMKVISHNDSETWLFKEPTKNIFKVRLTTWDNSEQCINLTDGLPI